MRIHKGIKIGRFTFLLYKSFRLGFLRFDESLFTNWWLDIGPLTIIKEIK